MERDFNTQGGYFAPHGYLRINTGGSHEENPNGGVQLGVDPQGIPNMLEEGEPVYNDYVYSDNIRADKGLLKKHNLPEKYAGKLYSEIADAYVDEAEDRPLDPISNNGLNAMLVRLADAQEEQKQIAEQKELEEQLASMSPEELAQLEQMMAAQEEPETPQVAAQPFACGGLLRRFDAGGPLGDDDEISRALAAADSAFEAQREARRVTFQNEAAARRFASDEKKYNRAANRMEKSLAKLLSRGSYFQGVQKNYDTLLKEVTNNKDGLYSSGSIYRDNAEEQLRSMKQELDIYNKQLHNTRGGLKNLRKAASEAAANRKAAMNGTFIQTVPTEATLDLNFDDAPQRTTVSTKSGSYDLSLSDFAKGGLMRKFKNAGFVPRKFPEKLNMKLNMPTTSPYPEVDLGLQKLNFEVPADNLATFRYKQRNGIQPEFSGINFTPSPLLFPATVAKVKTVKPAALSTDTDDKGEKTVAQTYPTWPRYAGALTSALTGLYDAFQEPDHYEIPAYRPVMVSGRMPLLDPVYNPIDQNMAVNDVLASGAGTTRAITNSGLGPSTAAALIAANSTIGQNIGTARTQVAETNAQRLNDVIAQRNAGVQAQAQFDLGINQGNVQTLNQAQLQNIQNNLLQQRLNYDAEGQKYAALSSQIDQVGQALSGIGQENFNANMVNSSPEFAYWVDKNGNKHYKGQFAKGGTLLKKYSR